MLAKAGIQGPMLRMVPWTPACAGVTIPQCDVAATFANLRNEVLARISLGAFFVISGGNKLFVAAHTREMYETIAGAGIPFPHVMAYFVSSVEFICGSLLII